MTEQQKKEIVRQTVDRIYDECGNRRASRGNIVEVLKDVHEPFRDADINDALLLEMIERVNIMLVRGGHGNR